MNSSLHRRLPWARVAPALICAALVAGPAAASVPAPGPPPAPPAAVQPPAQAGTPVATPGNAPALVVESENLDLGRVDEGKDAVATFVLKNTGTAELKILSARPG